MKLKLHYSVKFLKFRGIFGAVWVKQTATDLTFAKEFARQLRPKYDRARKLDPHEPKVKFDAAFARTLGVDRAALWKYLNSTKPPTPAIRTLVLAFKNYQISVYYEDVDTRDLLKNKPRRKRVSPEQMDLPFVIRASGPHNIGMKLEPQRVKGRVWRLKITAV